GKTPMDCGGMTPLWLHVLPAPDVLELTDALALPSVKGLRGPVPAVQRRLPVRRGSVFIVDFQVVDLEAIDGPHLRGRRRALEPGRRAPRILIGHRHQSVLNRILMRVVQTRPVTFLEGQPRLTVIVPDFAASGLVEAVDPNGSRAVQLAEHCPEAIGGGLIERRVGDEMVVVREPPPTLRVPSRTRGRR